MRSDEEGGDLEEVLEAAVRRWLDAEWPFETVRWPGREISWEDWDRAAGRLRQLRPLTRAGPLPVQR